MQDVNLQVNRPSSPASILARWIDDNHLSQKQAARELRWKEPEISMIRTNRRPISERMANDLARTLKHLPGHEQWTAQDWLELQRQFNEWTKTAHGLSETWQTRAKTERVGVLCDDDIIEAVRAGALKIDPFNESYVQPASYDLTAATLTWFGRRDSSGQRLQLNISETQSAKLLPGERVRIDAREHLHIPVNMSARVAAVGSLVHMGVLCAFGIQLDPGWSGQPFFTLFHQGDEDIEIGLEDACVSVEFQFLQRTPKNPFVEPRSEKFAGRSDR
jgi:deoxycytidine triphosphate deaminase/plasmid maintenance system antidote protein VapI